MANSLFEQYYYYKSENEVSSKNLRDSNRDNNLNLTDELETIFSQAKQLLDTAINKKDYALCHKAIELFNKAAYLPRARSYFVKEILHKSNIPLLGYDGLTQDMLEDPSMFMRLCFISEYHFYRYFTKLAAHGKDIVNNNNYAKSTQNSDFQGTIIPFPLKK